MSRRPAGQTSRARTLGPAIRTEGGLIPADLLERIAANDPSVPGLDPETYHLDRGVRLGEAITRSWNRLVGAWAAFREELEQLPDDDPATRVSRERWLLPLFEELGFGRLQPARTIELDGRSYPISHLWGPVPIHLVGAGVDLDRRTSGVAGAARHAPHTLVQEFLNRSSEHLWGIVSNGLRLRLLRDNRSLTRQAYLEFDLESIFAGEAYADFALLWLVAHESRFEGERPEACWLERWVAFAASEGTRALDRLRDGVEAAIRTLGSGFLRHPANGPLRAALQSGALDRTEYYRQLLRLVYRLLFLFTAEDRGLLLDPKAPSAAVERYARYYSTARLRLLATRRRGSRYGDLWAMLRVVVRALGSDEGAPGLALPPLGGFLFGPDACPDLERAEIANGDLLEAVRSLATHRDDRVLRSVDYRNLGAEELGSVYESLLELHPELNVEAATFELRVAAGHERKTTGSYYTPTSLVAALLDTALDPVLEEAARAPNPEAAILALRVVDPAAGSGHFLVAAAHRIARRLAAVRSGEEEPSPETLRAALRDVIAHCIYAVDVNPMAVELCKVSLWLEALEPGKPLSFLDGHIKCGNSLLGTTLELLAGGIPDGAYEPITGDDRAVAAALKRQNRAERTGQLRLGELDPDALVDPLVAAVREIEALPAEAIGDIHAKEARYRSLLETEAYRRAKLAADAWCAAFVAPKQAGAPAMTTGTLRQLAAAPSTVKVETSRTITDLANAYRFFHWELEFPDVFRRNGDGERGGFDVVLGNPPWERVKLQEEEFFAERSPSIANAGTAAERKRRIAALEREDPALWAEYRAALRRAEGESQLLRRSGRFPLAGRGDVNTYAVFAETFRWLIGPTGRAGLVVPTGIATDDTTKRFFRDLVEHRQLESLLGFDNRKKLFPAVGSMITFCLLTLTGSRRPARSAEFAFFCHDTSDLADPERRFTLSPEDLRLLNPNTGTAPIFRSRRDAELTKQIYRRVPVLVEEGRGETGNPWAVEFLRMFDMANDSGLFRTREQLEAGGFRLDGNVFVRGGDRYLPLYEAKMVHQFDHRFGDYAMQPIGSESTQLPDVPLERLTDPDYRVLPRYWVAEADVEARLAAKGWDRGWLLGWRRIARSTDERTVIAAVIPRAGVGDNVFLFLSPLAQTALVAAVLLSAPFDFAARQKLGGTNMNFFIFEQLPVLPPEAFDRPCPWSPDETLADWIRPRVLELTYTAWDLEPFARDLGWIGPPFRYDPERRALLRAELDACFFHLYLGSAEDWAREATDELRRLFPTPRDAVIYILEQFPIVKRRDEERYGEYRTARLVLDAYDRMADAAATTTPYRTLLAPPPADAAVAHPPRPGEAPGRWVPVEERPRLRPEPPGPEVAVARPRPPRRQPAAQYPARPVHGEPALPRAAETAASEPTQATLDGLARTGPAADGWLPEHAVDPSALRPGLLVRHDRFGTGTILAVDAGRRPVTVTVQFPDERRLIAFGYGHLDVRVEP